LAKAKKNCNLQVKFVFVLKSLSIMQNIIRFLFVFSAVILVSCGGFNKAYKHYEEGEYQDAIETLKKLQAKKPDDPLVNFYLAQSLRKSNRLREAEEYYAKVYNKKIPKIHHEDHEDDAKFYYAVVLEENGKVEEALKQYENYAKKGKNRAYVARAKREVENLKKREELEKIQTFFEVKPVENLNTNFAEFAPVIYQDKLVLSASRDKSHESDINGQKNLGIYYVPLQSLQSGEAKMQVFDPNIHKENVNEGTPTFSRDGKTMIFARAASVNRKKGPKNMKLYISELDKDGNWTEPRLLEGVSSGDNESYYGKPTAKSVPKAYVWDAQPFLSADGQRLYFVSDREADDKGTKSIGRHDIFVAEKKKDGTWGNVRNLGKEINTEADEYFPYVAPDGRLYFASDGHPSLGGLDIFVAERKEGKITVENLGKPINSAFDDFGIMFINDREGYFSSNRAEGKGDDDIFYFIDKNPGKRTVNYFVKFKTIGVKKDETEIPLANAHVKILDDNDKVIQEFFTNDKAETETIPVKDDRLAFKVVADVSHQKKPFLAARNDFALVKIPEKYLPPKPVIDTTFVYELKLQEYDDKTKFTLNILYDFNKWNIRPDAAKILDEFIVFLKDNPNVKIELGSHTDAVGNFEDNDLLSKRRAESAVEYIVTKGGFDKERIVPQGYGEYVPRVVTKELAEQYDFLKEGDVLDEAFINKFKDKKTRDLLHQLNRRTEIRILR
jgi:outer membrane protein OmpA-like peptidoglycan-associated protein/tetratricopeptide (TPR) repeat protein